jgi:transposase-like protein
LGSKKSSGGEASPTLRKRLAQVRECETSGETLKAYAERHGLSVHVLYQAKKLARQQGLLPPHRKDPVNRTRSKQSRQPRFLQVVRRSEDRQVAVAWRLRFPMGVVFESGTPITPDEIVRLVQALRSPS